MYNENIINKSINKVSTGKEKVVLTKIKRIKPKHPIIEMWRKIHRWLGLLISILVLNFAISGIILNHREELAFVDIPRSWMPNDYQYMNWNNASAKSILHTSQGTFIYGNIGTWKKQGQEFVAFNQGLPNGADNKNVHSMIETTKGDIYAGTFSGLYKLNKNKNRWDRVFLPTNEQRVIKLIEKDKMVYVLTRSNIITLKETTNNLEYKVIKIKEPIGYKKEASLFETIWQIHSGEILWMPGKIFMDIIGIIFIFIVVSGIIKWYVPKTFKNRSSISKSKSKLKRLLKFNLRWHNRLGLWLGVFLILSSLTGMFLRPPLLILIAQEKVGVIPSTNLEQSNPWHDKLRNITWSKEINNWIFATNESLYYVDEYFRKSPQKINNHPPISVMGVNVMEESSQGGILVGSFAGLFLWYPATGLIFDYVLKKPSEPTFNAGPPVGAFLVSGYGYDENGKEYYFDYNMGAVPLNSNTFLAKMPKEIKENSKMSLWNVMLEFHTARIFKALINDFYILIVPISGIIIVLTSISGIIIWFLVYKGKKI